MDVEEILVELRESERDGSLQIFRKLITCGPIIKTRIQDGEATFQPVLIKLLKLLSMNRDHGKEQILLISHAFLILLYKRYEMNEFRSILQSYLQAESNLLRSFDEDYNIQDLDLFKLLIAHGYLQINRKEIYSGEICELPFEVLYENCIKYTKYTHLAYKILHTWLQRTSRTDFWETSNPIIEKKLETIIYSNWDNSIKEVSKQNSTAIFNEYLKIMNKKYEGFLNFVFQDCLDNISPLNETKYVILAEICNVWDNVEAITEQRFILSIFTSLTKNYLKTSGTKLYNAISNKLGEERWKNTFGYPISAIILQWERGPQKNYQALQLLCTQWLEPTIKKHRSILIFLWELSDDVTADSLFRSHLERIASEIGVFLQRGTVRSFLDHNDEYLRLNSFATHCEKLLCFEKDNLENHFSIVKNFLFYNVNSSSTFMRRGVIKCFKIFLLNLLKSCNAEEYYEREELFHVFKYLHEFFLDCFEIGSCYQRKILGIKLYEIILFYTNEREMNIQLRNDPRYREDFNNGFKMKEKLEYFGEWNLTNRTILFWLFKLVLDPATDVKEISTAIILQHFQKSSLNDSEKEALLHTAIARCNSSKFYETESGSMLLKILSKWLPFEEINEKINETETEIRNSEGTCRFYKSLTTNTKYVEYLLNEADNQLIHVKEDILKAAMQSSPFHGTLTAILNVAFRNELKTEPITVEFTEKLLTLLEKAVNSLLTLLSSKSSDCEFSSSFAEMGLAIDKTVKESEISDQYDDVVLSPAHQVVITCIWISLKVSCEIASEIGTLTHSYDIVERSANLITSVLMKCRHKGAIEAAGIAIGNLTRKLVNVKGYNKLPEEWLNGLTSGDKMTPNLTRRSAGLSIMFHRIVSNDNRNGRPLVHIAIVNLLHLLENASEIEKFGEILSPGDEKESYQDLPRAKYLHFLQRLVADSELHAQVVPYLEKITMKCFNNLQSKMWTVRNASLQLFGAIVPRIAGQNNGGETLDFGNGYSVDHFITHYAELSNHIYSELENAVSGENCLDTKLKYHSAIVPSLILLSRMCTGGSDFIDYSSKLYILKAKRILRLLFASPIGNVRILAAKAYAALVSFPEITTEYQNLKLDVRNIKNLNSAHGYMCAIKFVDEKFHLEKEVLYSNESDASFDRETRIIRSRGLIDNSHSQLSNNNRRDGDSDRTNSSDEISKENIPEISSRLSRIKEYWQNLYSGKIDLNLCYVVEAMSLTIFQDLDNNSLDIFSFKEIGEERDSVLNTERSKPGFNEFVDSLTRLYANRINDSDNIIDKDVIRRILNSQCTDQSVTFLNTVEFRESIQDVILDHVLNGFPYFEDALLDAIIQYSNKSINSSPRSFSNADEIEGKLHKLLQTIRGDEKYCKLKLFCYILINNLNFDSRSMNAIVDYCFTKAFDDDEVVRKSSAECLPCILLHFRRIENDYKFKVLRLCLALLKDEVSEIRELARINVLKLFETDFPEYASSPLGEILYHKIFEIIINNPDYLDFSIIEIVQFFSDYISSINCEKDLTKPMVESPFDHEDEATSLEETKLFNIIYQSIRHLEETEVSESNLFNSENNILKDCGNRIKAKNEIQVKSKIEFSDLRSILDLNYNDYMIAKKDIVLKLCNLMILNNRN